MVVHPRRLPALAPERRQLLRELVHLRGNGRALALEEVRNRAREAAVAHPMGAVGGRGEITPLDLVGSLGARLDAREPVLDGEIERAVIADLEMQERVIADAAPVPAEERVR